ncbi:MAG: ROK family protein [Bacteroidales bacterium]|nr:ROK family protein [Bacteroidales bacterium]
MTDPIVLGVDIGGSHITVMGVNLHRKALLHSMVNRRHVDCHASADSILGTWAEALMDVISQLPGNTVKGIGFAMPGPFDYPEGIAHFKGVMKYDNLNNVPVREEIYQRLQLARDIPVRFLNDATCFAIGEAWLGPSANYTRTMAITLGTGFGSAFLDHGIPVEKGNEVPESGCVYHLPFGNSNADDHFSSRWFKRIYEERFSRESCGVKEMSAEAEHNPEVQAIFTEFGQNLGNFLAPWLVRFQAGCLTIGGNISRGYHLFGQPFRTALRSHNCDTEVFLSVLGEDAAIAGSARLTDDDFYLRLPFISNK